jgi:hypothetical protein
MALQRFSPLFDSDCNIAMIATVPLWKVTEYRWAVCADGVWVDERD